MKRLIFSLSLMASALAVSMPAQAVGRMVDVDVVERHTGRTLPVHVHRGEYWVAGTPGAPYSIRVRNKTGERLLAVMSVDGVNVLSGETASVGQSGYVFDGWRQSEIAGWRKSNAEIAAFEFTHSPYSYAERTGRPKDVGVIGVALFRERPVVVPQPYPYPAPWPEPHGRGGHPYEQAEKAGKGQSGAAPRAAAPAAPSTSQEMSKESHRGDSAAQSRVEPKLGTGHGQRETSIVSNTTFERASSAPLEVIRIRYDSYENLVSMGVIREWRKPHHPSKPNPFPESPVGYGYVPDPPHWR